MARELLICIHEWGMKKVVSMTVDNAKTNDAAIKIIVKKLSGVYDNGKQFHIRCMAHIINLIVHEGLKFQTYHVDCITNAVKYIRGSTQRIKTFKKSMKDTVVETQRFLCGETPTRWNSTFELLKSAYDVREAFVDYGHKDPMFEKVLKRIPEHTDFDEVKKMMDFLGKFKSKTEKISSSTKPLVHHFIREILDIELHLRTWATNTAFIELVPGMKEKYDKYWGDYKVISDYVFFAVLLDPQCKGKLLEYIFTHTLEAKNEDGTLSKDDIKKKADGMVSEIKAKLENFFKFYLENDNTPSSSQPQTSQQVVDIDCDDDNTFFGNFLNAGGVNSNLSENELQRYLKEDRIQFSNTYDILNWWKLNGMRYPKVAQMARDILGIQISTVASESSFSQARRVITDYRTNLSVPIVEALICTSDWLRKSAHPILDDMDDMLVDDELAIEIADAIENDKAMGKRPAEN